MHVRFLGSLLAALALVMFLQGTTPAQVKGKVHEGTIVSVKGQTFKMLDKNGKEMQHTLDIKGKVICDGKTCRLTDLKSGTQVRVTTLDSDPQIATLVEAKTKRKNR